MTSAVIILPAAMWAAGDALAESLGWGAGNFTRPLSADGTAPPTHYGCRAEVSPVFLGMLDDPPAEATAVLAALLATVPDAPEEGEEAAAYGPWLSDSLAPLDHWNAVLAREGLVRVIPEETEGGG